jgi:hypothetical protein
MSDPAELYMEIITAMRSGNFDVAGKYFDPAFVVHEDPGMPYGGVLKGADAFFKLRRKVYDTWGEGCLKLLFVCGDKGDHATANFKITGRPGTSVANLESFVTVVWTFRNGLATEARVFYYDTPRLSRALAGK